MTLLLILLGLLMCGGVADAQIVSPMLAPAQLGAGTTSLPSGAPPQVVGYSAANTGESETVGGDFTYARTGPNAYTATITKLNGTPVGALATLNAGSGLSTTTTTLSLTAPVTVPLGGTGTTVAPSAGAQLLISQSASAYAPQAMTGDASITAAGAITVTKIAGTIPGGTCGAGTFVSVISASGVPTCTTPAITGVPSGTAPQIVGYTAGGVAETETVSGGAGGCSFTRTGTGAYQMVCTTYAPTASPTFTGTATIPTLALTSGTVSTGLTMNAGSTFTGPDGGIWTNSGINDGTIKATTQFTFPDNATWTTAGLNNGTHLGIGQAAGTSPINITGNQNSQTSIAILNNSTGTFAQAGVRFDNGTTNANIGISGTGYTGSGSTTTQRPNALYVQSGMPGGISMGNDGNAPIYFSINGTTVGQFAANGFHLPSAPLEIASGGTGTATAPTVGQALVATSASAYAPTTLAMANISDYTPPTTFTPAFYGSTGTGSNTYNLLSGYYTTIGHLCHVQIALGVTATSGMAGNLLISGLPKTSASGGQEYSSCSIAQYSGFTLATNYIQISLRIDPGVTFVEVMQNTSNAVGGAANLPATSMSNIGQILATCDYIF